MGFAINTRNMHYIANYREADKFFNTTPQPRGKRWSSDERPLRDNRSHHLRMVTGHQHGVKYYDLFLYQTPLIRYYQPNEQGEQAVWLQYFYSQSSSRFLWAHQWWEGKAMPCTDGTEFKLPIAGRNRLAEALWGDEFTVKLVFNADNKVIKSKSVHLPVFRHSSTATMRARRKLMKDKIEMMLTVVEMQYSSMVNDLSYDVWAGQPFKSARSSNQRMPDIKRSLIRLEQQDRYEGAISLSDDERTNMFNFAQQAAQEYMTNSINQRLYKLEMFMDGWYPKLRGTIPEIGRVRDLPSEVQAEAVPTQDAVRKAVVQRMLEMADLDSDTYKAQPLFPAKLGRDRISPYTREDMDNLPNLLGADLYYKLASRKGVVY